jgi:hypothetical protein
LKKGFLIMLAFQLSLASLCQTLPTDSLKAIAQEAAEQTRQYQVGQIWAYQTRSEEPKSTLTIIQIDQFPKVGKVIHIAINKVNVKSPSARDGYSHQIAHAPMSLSAMEKSTTELISEKGKVDAISMEGYGHWKHSFEAGKAGIFTCPVSEVVKTVEGSLSK